MAVNTIRNRCIVIRAAIVMIRRLSILYWVLPGIWTRHNTHCLPKVAPWMAVFSIKKHCNRPCEYLKLVAQTMKTKPLSIHSPSNVCHSINTNNNAIIILFG